MEREKGQVCSRGVEVLVSSGKGKNTRRIIDHWKRTGCSAVWESEMERGIHVAQLGI